MDSSISIKALRGVLGQNIFIQDELDAYKRYILQIENNIVNEPNIAFEATKSLGEAIFRHVLKHERIKVEFTDILTRNTLTTYDLFKGTCKALVDLDLIDIEILGLGQKFFNDMSQIRNSVGIISHGKDLRDTSNLRRPTVELAIANMINHILVILEAYQVLLGEQEVSYDDSTEFNEYLDNENFIEGISYSRALYDQDLVAYKELLDEYNELEKED